MGATLEDWRKKLVALAESTGPASGVYVAMPSADGTEPPDAVVMARFSGALVVRCTTARALSLRSEMAALDRAVWICDSLGGAEAFASCVAAMAIPRLRT